MKHLLLVIGKYVDHGKVIRRIIVDLDHGAIAANRHEVYFRHHARPPTCFSVRSGRQDTLLLESYVHTVN